MDLYLEDPVLWRGFHHRLISAIDAKLGTILPPRYVSEIEERVYVVESGRDVYPDVLVKKRRRRKGSPVSGSQTSPSGILTADPPLLLSREQIDIHESYVEVRLVGTPHPPVAVIEVLSPTNKASGTPGQQQYLDKQHEILQSPTHLLEIDLLRRGAFTVACPHFPLSERAEWDYLICLNRGGQNRSEVWPITVQERLPRILLPLAGKDPDLTLDLQEVFDQCYDVGQYAHKIDYRTVPAIPLSRHNARWANRLLREQGLRS